MTVVTPEKYKEAQLPATAQEAIELAYQHEAWAKEARDKDLNGSAQLYELMAKLLRFYAERSDIHER